MQTSARRTLCAKAVKVSAQRGSRLQVQGYEILFMLDNPSSTAVPH